ncbi:GtrA family protein [Kineococcus siccus]|uniref:GtrA family protein n=1 Tax=Kineococcus siccus TaxID=2696567 RepID=UPI0030B8021C
MPPEKTAAPHEGLVRRLRATYEVIVREAAKFGIVGGVAFVVNTGTFNLLRFAGPDGIGVLHAKPLTANVIGVVISTVVAWLGNRLWTFRHRRRASAPRELLLFAVMNAGGLAISLACLGFTYYVLDLRGPVATNVSANVVGLVLGTLFRWWAYRRFVFTTELAQEGWDAEPGDLPPSRAAQVDDVRGGQARPGSPAAR